MTQLHSLADELGFWPATTDDEHIAELRRQNAHYAHQFAIDPDGTRLKRMSGHWNRDDGRAGIADDEVD